MTKQILLTIFQRIKNQHVLPFSMIVIFLSLVTAAPGQAAADLYITTLSGPTSALTGSIITVNSEVRTAETGSAAGAFSIGFYLSTDTTITTADTYLGSVLISGLASGASVTSSTEVTIPSGVLPGLYYIGAIADISGQVAESNEENNSFAGNQLSIGIPDTEAPQVSSYTRLAAGSTHMAAIKTDGSLWGWGENVMGQVGDGTKTDRNAPVRIGASSAWKTVSAGKAFTVAITTDGKLLSWGNNAFGQLGDGSLTLQTAPVSIGTGTTWTEAAAGANHTLALKSDGTLWSWGANDNGQLGDGSVISKSAPQQIGADTTWIAVAAGECHSLALKSDHTIWAWGCNANGQLGDTTTADRAIPTLIGSDSNWSAIAAGDKHTLAIKTDGSLWSWGFNGNGRLGDNTTTEMHSPVNIGIANSTWKWISAGASHSLAIMTDGTLWTWGNNGFGQLGDGTKVASKTPKQIGADTTWTAVVGGLNYTAGLKSDGTLWTWGFNGSGQLGTGIGTSKSTPTAAGLGITRSVIAAGNYHSVSIKTDGTLWAWGRNNGGQVGDGSITNRFDPASIGTGTAWSAVSAGAWHSLAVTSDGTLWSWGMNTFGQLGDGTLTDKPAPVQIGAAGIWRTVAAGSYFTLGLKKDGTLWSWGKNDYGQLGYETTAEQSSPAQIGTDSDWKAIAVGASHALGLKTDGSLWSWGYNFYGQLGDGTTVTRTAPARVGTDADWSSVVAGANYSMALKTDGTLVGTLWSWGHHIYGQLGDGTTTKKTSPAQVGTGTTWRAVAAGNAHTIALMSDGTLWAWGWNASGQLGDGTVVNKYAPVQIGTDTAWSQIAAGYGHTLALKTNGELWSWGYNEYGQLGDGNMPQSLSPSLVATGGEVALNNGALYTNSAAVTVTLTVANPADVVSMQFSNDGTTWSAGEAYGATKSWTLLSGDGTKTVYARISDSAGNWSSAFSDTIILDTTAPLVEILSPASSTNDTTPLLKYSLYEAGTATVTVDANIVSKVSGNSLAILQPGVHTVKVELTDAAGNPGSSEVTFTVDTTAPTGSILIKNGDTSTNSASVVLNLTAYDEIGVSMMQFKNESNGTWSDPVAYAATTAWALSKGNGTKTVFAQFMDMAGNLSSAVSDTITLDIAPTVTELRIDPYEITLSYGEFARIIYTLSQAANVTISLVPMSGAGITVFEGLADSDGAKEGENTVEWRGIEESDTSGKMLQISEDGNYTVTIRAVDPATGSASAIVQGSLGISR